MRSHHHTFIGITLLCIIIASSLYFFAKHTTSEAVSFDTLSLAITPTDTIQQEVLLDNPHEVTHIDAPESIQGFYISKHVAASSRLLTPIIDFIDQSEINSVVIDIQDATGRVSFLVDNELVASTGSPEDYIKNISELINNLHEKNIYVIGRISVFQNPYLTSVKPSWAITRKDTGLVWKDHKGLSFLDPANREVWDYVVALAQASYDVGFDEINFDYIRYPSDGDVEAIDYKLGEGRTRAENIRDFFAHLYDALKTSHPAQFMSADLFGYTTTLDNDLGIGQIWEYALPYFDYLDPMIYPSHYNKGTIGIANPAEEPYKIIHYALDGAIRKTEAAGFSKNKIRPWIQDFSLATFYGPDKVAAQIDAARDLGINSWLVWDPSNSYTYEAYQ